MRRTSVAAIANVKWSAFCSPGVSSEKDSEPRYRRYPLGVTGTTR